MKKVGACENCGRTMYTNDLELCKKCNNEVGVEFFKNADIEEEVEEAPSLEGLDLGGDSGEGSVVVESEEKDTKEAAEEKKEE